MNLGKVITNPLCSIILALGILTGCATQAKKPPQTKAVDQTIKIDGSSTVYPLTKTIVEEYQNSPANLTKNVPVTVQVSGTGGGFQKFCAGETHINNASRPITTEEMEACKNKQVAYIELPIAFDAIAIVVNQQNKWLNSITTEELKKIWETAAEEKITHWNQINPDFPNEPINLFGPGIDSGTFDYFTEAIMGEPGASRSDYFASEDDYLLSQKVGEDLHALGYFSLAYEQQYNNLKLLAVDSGQGAIIPNPETIKNGAYKPLSRPLFIYVNAAAAQKNEDLRKLIDFYLEQAPEIASNLRYISLPAEAYELDKTAFHTGKVGTAFEGKSQLNLTLYELLTKQRNF
ncbi:MAG: PstS family phosphate ABC transporter substrate-binding protein [Gomphosphaeria aponina SAG 52.96 = DSM 107014]|uniref:Phosphate-binding protein n=1 Tax=Gomphosphaeria aponina SAG 52.96 = DSM 107014 TaxID=1521640 RepID=A0A941JT24_9CHRO|nr:PstS family phosphate ABC transporter substrate-binding protein [Gomphosphaeria aponina SAG 52.96 = DSM 107014]